MATGFEGLLEDYGVDMERWLTPEQQFRTFATQFQPGRARSGFYTQQQPLSARYALQQPTFGGTFGQFLGGYPGAQAGQPAQMPVTPMTGEQLRTRAQAIGGLTGMTDPQFFQYVEDPTTVTGPLQSQLAGLTPGQLASYRESYLGGQQSEENVMGLVNLLALQRGAGEPGYTGQMQEAIGRLISDLHTQYMAQTPSASAGSFLNWYLGKSDPTGTGQLRFNAPAPAVA